MHLPAPTESNFELPPSGTFIASCYRIIDLGTQQTTYMGQPKTAHKILVSWELHGDDKMADGRLFTISQRYTWSMNEKASLRRDLESWRGVPFRDNDFGPGGFDIKNILGKACLLTIVHSEKGDKKYANISAVSKLMKGMDLPKTENELSYLWLDKQRWDAEAFSKLGQGLQGIIIKSPEYAEIVGAAHTNGHVTDAKDFHDDPIPF